MALSPSLRLSSMMHVTQNMVLADVLDSRTLSGAIRASDLARASVPSGALA